MKTRITKGTGRPAAKLLAVVPSASDPTKQYEIKESQVDGVIYCSCPAWKFQRLAPKDRTCKHILALQSGALTPPRVVRQPQNVEAPRPVIESKKEVNVGKLREVATCAKRNGAKNAEILGLLKEGGLSSLSAWSILQELGF